ncbi:MAG TPA: hypothetical protein VFA50_18675 [Stellaceae bacterium]|nr:hypothetical protein [Stellaceae bacterium]
MATYALSAPPGGIAPELAVAHAVGFFGANCAIGPASLWLLHAVGYLGGWAAPSAAGAAAMGVGILAIALAARRVARFNKSSGE